jgi:hypothetical protein
MYANSKLLPLSIMSTAITLAFFINQGFAGDAKTQPGSMGVRYAGASPSYNASAIGNPSSTEWVYLDLPVINDDMSNDIGYSNVRVLDRHYTSDVCCSVNSVYWNSSASAFYGWWGATKCSAGSSNNLQYLITGGVSGAGSTYHQYFSCRIPPTYSGNRSYIVSYYVDEN